jgi:hypothetical protein
MPAARTRLQNAVVMLGVPAHQLAAAAAPRTRTRDLVNVGVPCGNEAAGAQSKEQRSDGDASGAAGNFNDLQALLDNFTSMPVFELGKPLPSDKYLPRRRVGSCPAAHNRELLGKLRR